MFNIVVWGAGRRCKEVLESIRKDKCNLIGIADSDKKHHKKNFQDKWLVDAPEELIDDSVDYIIISVLYSDAILAQSRAMGINDSKIIDFWHSDKEYDFIDANVKKIYELEKELEKCKWHLNNIPYELGIKKTPIIRSAEELLKLIIQEKKSLSRFGDGELEIMRKRERPWFQMVDDKLAKRLDEIFHCKDERIIIALADDFGNLDCYVESSVNAIRQYLYNGIREDLMQVIDMERVYYDAYVTRPYLMYKDKQHAVRIFKLFKKIWEKRNILLVEGQYAYNGVRNDLFKDAAGIHRIIAPAKNAFSMYDEILETVNKYADKDTLALISLGPTATVLAYDLAMRGIQAIDIGQLDNEYEWYMRGADKRIEIPGKCVAELVNYRVPDEIMDSSYEGQILAQIGI